MRREQVEIKKLGINGEGIGYIQKKICFVDNALPGEVVEVEIADNNRKYLKGKVIRTLKTSKYREESFCKEDHFCLGCAFTSFNYQQQLLFKKDLLKDALKKYTHFHVDKLPIKKTYGAKTMKGYRHVVSLPVAYFKGKIVVGIYQRESKYLTLMDQCPMQDPLINQTLVQIEKILNEHKVKDYNDKFKKGLRFMRLRNIDGQIQVLFVCGNDGLKDEVIHDISQIEAIKSIYFTINTTKYQEFEKQGYTKLYGKSQLAFECFDQSYLYSIKSEFPVHPEMEKNKLEIIRSLIQSQQSILSLYCGIGLLELSLDNEIVAIDDKKYHIQDAQNNAARMQKDNVTFIAQDIDEGVITQCKKKAFDCLIIRHEQMSQAVMQSILLSKVEDVIYVSDHPSSLAKDLENLSSYYHIKTMIPLDMNPYSSKVETIVHLHRK